MSEINDRTPKKCPRLLSLDVYRGLIMVTLAFNGFGLAETASLFLAENQNSSFWLFVHYQTSHVEWQGCSFWDLIQPSFLFIVGMSMAYSYVRRQKEGHSYQRMLGHAFVRSLILISLGILLNSNNWLSQWWLTNVLAQIGLGYTFLFLLWDRSIYTQVTTAVLILVGVWTLFVTYPESGHDITKGSPEVGITKEWSQAHLEGVAPAWHKNANVAHDFDSWFLNKMPRTPFTANKGGYNSLNFIPSIVTMLFGLMCGELLRSKRSDSERLIILFLAGFTGLILGWLLGATGICPIVKRIWTPSWTLFSAGWCSIILAAIYWVVDVKKYQFWIYPFTIVGLNSIAVYCMTMIIASPGKWVLDRLFGNSLFTIAGPNYTPVFLDGSLGVLFWIACWFMYRHNFFIRI